MSNTGLCSRESQEWWCGTCKKYINSYVVAEATTKNKLLNVVLCPFGYCFIPQELQKFRLFVHKCPECHQNLNPDDHDEYVENIKEQ